MQIHITRGEDSSGPFTLEQVRGYLAEGILLPDDLAWHEGLGNWITLSQLVAPPAAPQPVAAIPVVPDPSQTVEPVAAAPMAVAAKSSNKKLLVVGIVVGVLVLGGAAAALFFFQPKDPQIAKNPDLSGENNPTPLPPDPNTLIPGLPGSKPEPKTTNSVPTLPASLAEVLKGKRIQFLVPGELDIRISFYADGNGLYEEPKDNEKAPMKWSVKGNRVSFGVGSDEDYLIFEDTSLAIGSTVVVLTRADTPVEDGIKIPITKVEAVTVTEPTLPEPTPPVPTLPEPSPPIPPPIPSPPGSSSPNATEPEPQTSVIPHPITPVKELTAKEAAEVMAFEIGNWETKGRGLSVDGELHEIEMTMEARWEVEGKSVEYKFTMVEDGKTVSSFGHKKYDAAKGIFIYRSKWGENPETTSHERYDPDTRTSHAQTAPTTPPTKTKTITVGKRVGDDKTQQKLEVFEDGLLVYSHEIVSTRVDGNKPTNPEPTTPPLPTTPEPTTDADSARILEQAIRKTLKMADGDALTPEDLAKVKTLTVSAGTRGPKVKDLAYLKRCINLERLFLQGHAVKDLGPLAGLKKLVYFNLDRNQVADLAPLAKLPVLKEVWLQGNLVTNLGPLAGLKTIEELRLDANQITDLAPLGGLTLLRELSLNENQVADLKPLAGLAQLEELGITKNPAKDFLPLAALVKLKTLKFSPAEGSELGPVLGPMKALEQVSLSGTVMKNLGPLVGPLKDHPALVSISASQCQVEDISALADLPQLERLQLMGNRITDLKALDGMARLNSLILSNNRVADLSPLTGAPNLSTLWLSGNQVQDATPLKELKKLRTVLLQANRVTPAQLEELRQAIPGCRVNNKTAKP